MWPKCAGGRQACQCWREIAMRSVSAMLILGTILLLLTLAGITATVVSAGRDGYRQRDDEPHSDYADYSGAVRE